VYILDNALTEANLIVPYLPGYSGTQPFSSQPAVSIDHETGAMKIYPTASEGGLISTRVYEYRNGTLIGISERLITQFTMNCNGQLPVASGIWNTNQFEMIACVNDPVCFTLSLADSSVDSVTVSWNSGISGSTFTSSSSQFPISEFCWTPTVPSNTNVFTVLVRDNICPTNNAQIFTYNIRTSICTSVDEQADRGLSVYPNPASENFKIYLRGLKTNAKIKLTDIAGSSLPFLYSIKGEEIDINTTNLNSGIYIINVSYEEVSKSFRIVKQ
jgi:hypothetical protein